MIIRSTVSLLCAIAWLRHTAEVELNKGLVVIFVAWEEGARWPQNFPGNPPKRGLVMVWYSKGVDSTVWTARVYLGMP